MKIGILGTRGIPNQYGGFEQLAEYLSVGLLKSPSKFMYTIPTIIPTRKKRGMAFISYTALIRRKN